MKFLQKRWVSVVLCIAMIVVAIGITSSKNSQSVYQPESQNAAEEWGEEHYESYTRFIDDRANVLSEDSIRKLSAYNAALDYSYSSICGVVVVNTVGAKTMEDAAYDMSEELQLGDMDALLLVDLAAKDWYFAYGPELSYYVDHELELIFRSAMDSAYDDLDSSLDNLFSELSAWYRSHMPLSETEKISAGSSYSAVLFVPILIIILIVAVILSSISRVRRRVIGGWGPTFYFGGYRHRPFRYGPGPGFGPNPGPRPRPTQHSQPTSNRPSGRSGGFGGSSRGGGFSGRSGGFGGSSRGGGFRGRR